MRQWVKEHPWRLEIVPFILIVLGAVFPLLSRDEIPVRVRILPIFHAGYIWAVVYSLGVATMVCFWIGMLQLDHDWPKREHDRKLFNYWAVLYVLFMPEMGYIFLQDVLGGKWLIIWIALMFTAWIPQLFIERSRPFVPWQEAPEYVLGAQDIQVGDAFYYREVQTYWWMVVLTIWAAIYAGFFMWSMSGIWWKSAVVSGTFLPTLFRARSVFIVSNERIAARVGFKSLSILMDDVRACGLRLYNQSSGFLGRKLALTKYDGMYLYIPPMKSGICLKLETTDGKIYLIGLKNPRTACKLIRTALAARKQEDSTDFSH